MKQVNETGILHSMKNAFDREEQVKNKRARIVAGVERLSTIFRAALQEEVKEASLSPLQGQILMFIATHAKDDCAPSILANEFAVKKPTVSDSIKVLIQKGLLKKEKDKRDARSAVLTLTTKGKSAVKHLSSLTTYFEQAFVGMSDEKVETIWSGLVQLLAQLQQKTNIPARMCTSCQFYQAKTKDSFYCDLLKQKLPNKELRVDCEEHIVAIA